jgi:ABC-type lipoprotein export system ATPase subunit
MVHAEALTRTYRMGVSEVVGVQDIRLEIDPGEMVVLTGDSGSGKSTLLALLAGLDRPTRGMLNVAGHDLCAAGPTELHLYRRDVVGMVFQTFNLLPTLTAVENVCLPGLLSGRSLSNVRRRAGELLEWLNLDDRMDHLPGQLSGGEMQRTAIARALINEPDIILADEPTGNLDTGNGRNVMELLGDLNRRLGRLVIIATHSHMADPYATREIRLKDGRISGETG